MLIVVFTKLDLISRTDEPNYHLLNSKDTEKASLKEKEVLNKRNVEADEALKATEDKASDALQYAASGSVKVRTDGRRLSTGKSKRAPIVIPINIVTKNVLALPSTVNTGGSQLNSPLLAPQNDANLLNPLYSYVPTLSSNSYPSIVGQPIYSPYSQYPYSQYPYSQYPYSQYPYSQYPYLNGGLGGDPLNSPVYGLVGGQYYNPLLAQSPYINPYLSYLVPQQTPNVNYLNRASFGGLNNGYYDGLGDLSIRSFPSIINAYPTTYLNPSIIPSTSYYPYVANQPIIPQPVLPQSAILPQAQVAPQELTTRRVAISPQTVAATNSAAVVNNALPFSDALLPTTTTTASTVLIPGVTDQYENLNSEKPLLYSSQNAALRSPYNPLITGAYSNRIIDPIAGQSAYLNAYPSSYYSRYTTYPTYPTYSNYLSYPTYPIGSSYYRPAGNLISSPYRGVYGPYNGVGFISPMHYSSEPQPDSNSILTRKSEQAESKPVVVTNEQTPGKDGLMYTIKTSKTESKETVSRLNQNLAHLDTNKIRDEDRKKA